MSITNPKKGLRGLVLLASLAVGSVAHAGHWTATKVEWITPNSPGIGTDGGEIELVGTTVHYKLSKGINAPVLDSLGQMHNSSTASPGVQGTFRFLVDWVSDGPSDPEPAEGIADVQVVGTATATTTARRYRTGTEGTGSVQVTDPYFVGMMCASSTSSVQNNDADTYTHPNSGVVQHVVGGVGQPVLTNDGTLHHTILMSVNSIASVNASGSGTAQSFPGMPPLLLINAYASAGLSLDVTIRVGSPPSP